MEIAVWRSIYRFLLRRPRVPAGAVGFTYHQPVLPLLIGFLVASAIELVAVDLLVQQWPLVRIPLLVVGIWGLLWMLGLLLGYLTRPHAVGPAGIRVRDGAEIDIAVPWEAVESVAQVSDAGKPAKVADTADGRVLSLWMQQATNVEVVLAYPVRVRLPQEVETVDVLCFHADEAEDFMSAVRQHI
ncbi:hypothetical protein [Kocuria nitroreducens]|uniref:hypothetical protein n=1 Tax=Kocuria nitroreducens TaxID=3058914 RepID=UPI0036DDA4DF